MTCEVRKRACSRAAGVAESDAQKSGSAVRRGQQKRHTGRRIPSHEHAAGQLRPYIDTILKSEIRDRQERGSTYIPRTYREPTSKMGWQWGDLPSMKSECELIMESLQNSDGSNTKTKGREGRVWESCVSCGASAVLESAGWVSKKHDQVISEKNKFVFIVCGQCERETEHGVDGGLSGAILIHRDIMEASPAYQAIASYCAENGWSGLERGSERVVDRRVLARTYLPGMTLRSVRVEEVAEKWRVTLLTHVGASFL